MSKSAYLLSAACFVIGVTLGAGGAYFLGMAYSGKQIADGLALVKETEIAESGQQAFAAYQHESPQAAIYALKHYLDALQRMDEIVGRDPVFMTKMVVSGDMMLTHARLAKLYAESGELAISTQHVEAALQCASQDRGFRAITNQARLTEVLARIDKGASK